MERPTYAFKDFLDLPKVIFQTLHVDVCMTHILIKFLASAWSGLNYTGLDTISNILQHTTNKYEIQEMF